MNNAALFPTITPDVLPVLAPTHERVEVTVESREADSYSLVLPKTWVRLDDFGNQPDSPGQLVQIGYFVSAGQPDAAAFQVFVTRPLFEVDLADWLRFQADLRETPLTQILRTPSAAGLLAEASTETDGAILRMAACADSGRIFFLIAQAPVEQFAIHARDLAIAIQTFCLSAPSGSSRLERWLTADLKEPAFSVEFPMSWQPQPIAGPHARANALHLRLLGEKSLAGYVRVKAERAGKKDQAAAFAVMSREIERAGVHLRSDWRTDGPYSIATASAGADDFELRAAWVKRQETAFTFTAVSVLRAENPVLWMRTKRAFDIVYASAQPAHASGGSHVA